MGFFLFFSLFVLLIVLTTVTYYVLVCETVRDVFKRSLITVIKFTGIGMALFGLLFLLNFF